MFKNTFKQPLAWALTLALVLLGFSLFAVTVPHSFQSGGKIYSTEVNTNFTALANAVTALEAKVAALEKKNSFTGDLSVQLTGTVAVLTGATAVTGTGTLFTTEVKVGDAIKIANEVFTVTAVADNTHLTLDHGHTVGTLSTQAFVDTDLISINNGAGTEKLFLDKTGGMSVDGTIRGKFASLVASCVWKSTWANPGSNLSAQCPTGHTAISGACECDNAAVLLGTPTEADLTGIDDNDTGNSGTGWRCDCTQSSNMTVRVLCCPN
jgi:hypothetical protein